MEAALRTKRSLTFWALSFVVAFFAFAIADRVSGQIPQPILQNQFSARSQNFLVSASTQELADAVASNAERYRNELAEYWLGRRLANWPTPCPIEVISGPDLAAQGATTYNREPACNYQMQVVGTPERILDSVLPHEVTHTVMASHFGRPLPRWADEGICTTVEHHSERSKHEIKLREYLSTSRGIRMNELFLLKEYPPDMLPMYAQGYSVCRFLIEQSGPRKFIAFLESYMRDESWTGNIQKHYGYESLRQFQERWLAWVAQGSGPVDQFVFNSGRTPAAGQVRLAAAQNSSGASSANVALAGGGPAAAASPRRFSQGTAVGQISGERVTGSRPIGRPAGQISSGYYSASQPQSEQSYPTPVSSQRMPRRYR